MKIVRTKQLILAAMCVALGVVLPVAFHSVPNAGSIFLPMHLPVLLSGFLCGWPFGLVTGILTPLLSSLITGMPPAAFLPGMVFELATYGFMAGFLNQYIHTGNRFADLYIRLIGAMLAGRAVSGILNALIFSAGKYSLTIFLTGSFVTALPGIVIQLALLPIIIQALSKAGIPQHSK